MTTVRKLTLGGTAFAHTDAYDHDVEYIYHEIFVDQIYDHPRIRVPAGGTIVDVGGNAGIFSVWAARKWSPRRLFAYEASPTTVKGLAENLEHLVDASVTEARAFNLAVSDVAGKELQLNQPLWNSGISTMLDGSKLDWVGDLARKGGLVTHKVQSTTVSVEMAKHRIETIDLLKIDVEGHFMEVLAGIAPSDAPRIRNIALEAEYAENLGISRDAIGEVLRGMGFEVEARDAAQIMIYAWRT